MAWMPASTSWNASVPKYSVMLFFSFITLFSLCSKEGVFVDVGHGAAERRQAGRRTRGLPLVSFFSSLLFVTLCYSYTDGVGIAGRASPQSFGPCQGRVGAYCGESAAGRTR